MPTLEIPNDLYERLEKRAAARHRTPSEEAAILLSEALGTSEMEPPLLEFVPNEEISLPYDLPMPGPGVLVRAIPGKPPHPDPID